MDLPIVCPHCGNHGHPSDVWPRNAGVPFKLVEDVVRSFEFSADLDENGALDIFGDVETDSVDWESGCNLRIECMACFGQFALPENANVDFD